MRMGTWYGFSFVMRSYMSKRLPYFSPMTVAPRRLMASAKSRYTPKPPGPARVALLLRHPDAPVVAQRLAHQRELALVLAADGDAGGMELREAGIAQEGALLVRAPDRGGVGALGVRRQIEDVAVAAAGDD